MRETTISLRDGSHAVLLTGGADYVITVDGADLSFETHPICVPVYGNSASKQRGSLDFSAGGCGMSFNRTRVNPDGTRVWETEPDFLTSFGRLFLGSRH
ncbi:hypothetical protein [Azospirillum canadense]|uniref:hypothetical protein n=1 Tax=Azospirillum canadense TaxID=403962 RepID=UPI002225F9A9|nr:hypothetical protein [Azospirillum canadense]MCW2242234.1 hypothetical protein [Azospirillum canadense]